DLDALPGGASLRLEGLDPILDDDGEAQLFLEVVAARRDDLRFLERGQGRVSGHPPLLLVNLLGPDLVRARRVRAAASDGARRLRAGHRTTEPRHAGHSVTIARPERGVDKFRQG